MKVNAKEAYAQIVENRERLLEIFPEPYAKSHPRVVLYDAKRAMVTASEPEVHGLLHRFATNSNLRHIAHDAMSLPETGGCYLFKENTIMLPSNYPFSNEVYIEALAEESTHSMKIFSGDRQPRVRIDELSSFQVHSNDGLFDLRWLVGCLRHTLPNLKEYELDMDEFIVVFGKAFLLKEKYSFHQNIWPLFWENIDKLKGFQKVNYARDAIKHLPLCAAERLVKMYNGDVLAILSDHSRMMEMDLTEIWKWYVRPLLQTGNLPGHS